MSPTRGASTRGAWTVADVRNRTYKPRDAWWTVLLVDPVAAPLTALVANRTRLTPNQVTLIGFVSGLLAAGLFWQRSWPWLAGGAVAYHLSFTLDCVDGKLARLTGSQSPLGGLLDYFLDRVREVIVAVALFGGQFRVTHHAGYLYLGISVVALDSLRYLDSFQAAGVHRQARDSLQLLRRRVELVVAELATMRGAGQVEAHDLTVAVTRAESLDAQLAEILQPTERVDGEGAMHAGFNARVPWYPRLRRAMARRRIRTHLMSGIELNMAVFVVGPLIDRVAVVTVVAGLVMLAFEVGVMARVAASARDGARVQRDAEAAATEVESAIAGLQHQGPQDEARLPS